MYKVIKKLLKFNNFAKKNKINKETERKNSFPGYTFFCNGVTICTHQEIQIRCLLYAFFSKNVGQGRAAHTAAGHRRYPPPAARHNIQAQFGFNYHHDTTPAALCALFHRGEEHQWYDVFPSISPGAHLTAGQENNQAGRDGRARGPLPSRTE